MTAYVVDASAGVEYLLRTPAGVALAALLDDADLYAPELIDVEILSALRRGVLRHTLNLDRAESALDDLATWPLQRISHRILTTDAWELRHNFTAYDSFYVVAARRLGAGLVTADGPLSRAPSTGVATHTITPP